jgi:hypothetical protein
MPSPNYELLAAPTIWDDDILCGLDVGPAPPPPPSSVILPVESTIFYTKTLVRTVFRTRCKDGKLMNYGIDTFISSNSIARVREIYRGSGGTGTINFACGETATKCSATPLGLTVRRGVFLPGIGESEQIVTLPNSGFCAGNNAVPDETGFTTISVCFAVTYPDGTPIPLDNPCDVLPD